MLEINKYMTPVFDLAKFFLEKEEQNLRELGEKIFQSLRSEGVWHIFGSGHSALLADELFHRAGGLVPVNSWTEANLSPLVNPSVNRELERDENNAKKIIERHNFQKGEVLLIISNSGINGISVELAQLAKVAGLTIAALTSVAHSRSVGSRHSSGKKLFELADYVIDSSLPSGDAILSWEMSDGMTFKSSASSMVLGSIALHTLEAMIIDKFVEADILPPVLISANTDGGDKHNHMLEEKYSSRITKFRSDNG